MCRNDRKCYLDQLGGPQEKMSFFQIASGPILSIPFHLQHVNMIPVKFRQKKDPFLTYEPPKVSVFLALVTELVTDLNSLVTDPVYWLLH